MDTRSWQLGKWVLAIFDEMHFKEIKNRRVHSPTHFPALALFPLPMNLKLLSLISCGMSVGHTTVAESLLFASFSAVGVVLSCNVMSKIGT